MSELDDLPLVREERTEAAPLGAARPARAPIVWLALVGLALGAAGAWWWARDRLAPGAPARPATTGTEAAVAPPEAARPLPPLDQMDIFLRTLLAPLSASPALARWLATDDLIRQMANGIDRVSRGASPARDVSVLRPSSGFSTTGRSNALAVDAASYRRYDGLAALVAALDARAVADVYRTIQPRLDEAYRGLGTSEGGVDNAVSVALQLLIDTPAVSGPIRLMPGPGVTFAFADASLEQLPPAQKQLLRMGPENVARIQARLREIKSAIDTSQVR